MKTLTQSIRSEGRAAKIWGVLTIIFALLVTAPFAFEGIMEFEAGMALAFFSLVMGIVAIVMSGVYRRRRKLLLSLSDPSQVLAEWDAPDLYEEHGGRSIPALFGRQGVFYEGKPYCIQSYDCSIKGAQILYEEGGAALSILYTVPNSRNGALRHRSVLNIPIPSDRYSQAEALCSFYSEAGRVNM